MAFASGLSEKEAKGEGKDGNELEVKKKKLKLKRPWLVGIIKTSLRPKHRFQKKSGQMIFG